MSIPKVIHYCWFGDNPLPKSVQKCIESWRKYCPAYEIRRWNEDNFDTSCNQYCKTMAERKKWAFLSDYARLRIIYDHGGIYLDTDVELIRPMDTLIEKGAFMGFECSDLVATGLGFAAEKEHPFVKENMVYYETLTDFEQIQASPHITTMLMEQYGLVRDCRQTQKIAGMIVYASEFLCPKNERTGLLNKTKNTYSIHHYDASWFEESWKKSKKKRYRQEKIRYILRIPNRVFIKVFGEEMYYNLKKKLKRN